MTSVVLPSALAAAAPPGPLALSDAVVDFPAKAAEAAALLKALAHPGRLLLLCRLVDAERSVGELETLTGIGQPSLSQQLAVLRGERLVAARRDGKQMRYRVASQAALVLLQALCGLFCPPAAAGHFIPPPADAGPDTDDEATAAAPAATVAGASAPDARSVARARARSRGHPNANDAVAPTPRRAAPRRSRA